MDLVSQNLLLTSGGGAAEGEFIDNLFETHLYSGTSGTRSIVNGIDLSTHGGMVWFGARSHPYAYGIQSSNDLTKMLEPSSTQNPYTKTDEVTSFNTNGFTLGASSGSYTNHSNCNYVSHTFRKCPGFFDVVAWTGNNTAGRQIAHNLGSVPGAIFVRNTNGTRNWAVYHRGTDASAPQDYWMTLNENYARQNQPHWNDTAPTSTHFTLGNDYEINGPSSQTYVAYLFAHDEAVFGDGGNNSVIKCGNYTGNGSSNGPDINLGWEAQWLLVKRTNSTEDWMKFDHMRTSDREHMWLDDQRVNINTQDGDGAGSDSQPYLNWTSTGFKLSSNTAHTNGNGDNYIYIAVRRPDGAVGTTPTAGTQVFTPVYDSSGVPLFKTPNHYVDMSLQKNSNWATSGASWNVVNRLRSKERLEPQDTHAEAYNSLHTFDFQYGESQYSGSGGNERFSWNWKRYSGFDMLYYTGNGSSPRNINHSLNNIPEMIVCKKVDGNANWQTYHVGIGNTKYVYWNQNYPAQTSSAVWANTTPTESVFTIGSGAEVNENGYLYLALLFSSVDGISKLGSYTGTSSAQTITTGFSPRFLLIKQVSGNTGGTNRDWNVYDTVRGISSGNDKRLILNTTAAQNDGNYVDVSSTGFEVNSVNDVGANGNVYIYYAHA